MNKPGDAVVRSRVPEAMKRKAEHTFARMGLSVSEGIRLFLVQTIAQQRLPFDVKVPNAKTRAAMRDATAGRVTRVASIAALRAELLKT